jgi:hypothetical protein
MMDIQAGIAFGGLVVAGATFACVVLVQNRAAAIDYGRLMQRVDDLKEEGDGQGDLSLKFAEFKGEMTAEMRAQSGKIDGLVRDLVWLRQVALPDPEARPGRRGG